MQEIHQIGFNFSLKIPFQQNFYLTALIHVLSYCNICVYFKFTVASYPVGPENVAGTCANYTYTATKMFSAMSYALSTLSLKSLTRSLIVICRSIQQCQLQPHGGGNGINGSYYNSQNFTDYVGSRTDPNIFFHWDASPFPGILSILYTVRWQGFLVPMYVHVKDTCLFVIA